MGRRPFYRPWPRWRHIRGGWLPAALLGIGLALAVILLLDNALRPMVTALASAKAQNEVTGIINDAVEQTLADEAVAYRDLVTLEKDAAGQVSVLTTDSVGMNRLRTQILACILEQVEALDSQQLGVPLGALSGFAVASDWGPVLPVRVLTVATPRAVFRNQFTSAGINQTIHQVCLDVSVEVTLLIPGGTLDVPVEAQVAVAETLLVGEVPDSYLELPGDGS